MKIACAVIIAGGLYIGSYLALVEVRPPMIMMAIGPWECHIEYRVIGKAGDYLFFPIQKIDSMVNSGVWYHFPPDQWYYSTDGGRTLQMKENPN